MLLLQKAPPVSGNFTIMLIRISISILLTLLSGYVLVQVRNNFISGMNTYLLGVLVTFAITLLALNYRFTTNVTNDTARVSLRIGMFVVFVASVLLFYKQPTITNNGTQPRHYKDSPTLK